MGLIRCVSATSACSPASRPVGLHVRCQSVVQWLEQINDAGGVGGARGHRPQHGWSKTLEEAEATTRKTKTSGRPGNVQAGQLTSGWGFVIFLLADTMNTLLSSLVDTHLLLLAAMLPCIMGNPDRRCQPPPEFNVCCVTTWNQGVSIPLFRCDAPKRAEKRKIQETETRPVIHFLLDASEISPPATLRTACFRSSIAAQAPTLT